MRMLDEALLVDRVRTTVSDLLLGAEQLRGLAAAFDDYGSLKPSAEPDEIKQVAISVRATAVQALLTATTAVGLSERLSLVATILAQAEAPGGARRGSGR